MKKWMKDLVAKIKEDNPYLAKKVKAGFKILPFIDCKYHEDDGDLGSLFRWASHPYGYEFWEEDIYKKYCTDE